MLEIFSVAKIQERMASSLLLRKIEWYLAQTGMGPFYFGQQAAGNTMLVARLRAGKRNWPETIEKVEDYIEAERHRLKLDPPPKDLLPIISRAPAQTSPGAAREAVAQTG